MFANQHGQDGDAHMTVFINEEGEQASYVWDGRDTIALSYGGYAEPVTKVIAAPADLSTLPAWGALARFERVARDHQRHERNAR